MLAISDIFSSVKQRGPPILLLPAGIRTIYLSTKTKMVWFGLRKAKKYGLLAVINIFPPARDLQQLAQSNRSYFSDPETSKLLGKVRDKYKTASEEGKRQRNKQ